MLYRCTQLPVWQQWASNDEKSFRSLVMDSLDMISMFILVTLNVLICFVFVVFDRRQVSQWI